jgi:hypothetical protein
MSIYYKADESHHTPHGMVTCDEQGVVHPKAGYMSAVGWLWVRKDEHDAVLDHLDNVTAFYGQLEVRLKVMDGYIKFLESICKDKGVPLPKTYTLSLDKATQPAPNTSVDKA